MVTSDIGTEHVEFGGKRQTKLDRYGWKLFDEPGEVKYIRKQALCVPQEYQRRLQVEKANKYASEWSWRACACLVVARRPGDDHYYIIDGQHRHAAAMKRADVSDLPCLVFDVANLSEEARAFAKINGNRAVVPAFDLFRTLQCADDQLALRVQDVLNKTRVHFIRTSKTNEPRATSAVVQVLSMVKKDELIATKTLAVLSGLSAQASRSIPNRVLSGVFWIFTEYRDDQDKAEKIRDAMERAGLLALDKYAADMALLLNKGGGAIWGKGILSGIKVRGAKAMGRS